MQARWNNIRYYFFSFVYDAMLSWFYRGYVKKLVSAVNSRAGDNVLEIGVGTGITLPYYGPGKKITAIDPSAQMLNRAKKKLGRFPRIQVNLVNAAAENFKGDVQSFEHIIFCSSLSVINNPRQVLAAYFEKLKTGGHLYVLNHFTPEKGPLNFFDTMMTPVGKLLGFRSYFPLSVLVDSRMRCTHIYKGYWSIVQISKA